MRVAAMAMAAFALAAAGDCAKDLDQLAPFPCAADGSCPGGFACLSGSCEVANVDALGCSSRGVTCSNGIACFDDACEIACTSDGECGAGRLCTPPGGSGKAAGRGCVVDCTTGESCPDGFACVPREVDAASVCAPDGTTFATCTSASATATCLTELCGQPADFVVPCGTSACGFGDTCNAGSALPCECSSGFTNCDGTPTNSSNPCVQGSNGDPQCMCLSRDDPHPTCDGPHFHAEGSCTCVDGRTVTFACGDSSTCSELCAP